MTPALIALVVAFLSTATALTLITPRRGDPAPAIPLLTATLLALVVAAVFTAT